MSGVEQEFVPVGGRRDRKKEKKQPEKAKAEKTEKKTEKKAEKAVEKVEKKVEKKPEEAKPLINESTIICSYCYKIGHKSDSCPEKKAAKPNELRCIRCGGVGHFVNQCEVSFLNECFYCGKNDHGYGQCPERAKILYEHDGRKKESSLICVNCGCVGHSVRECKEPAQRRQVCMRCGEVGHLQSKCEKPAADQNQYRVCHHCGEIGHIASECKVPSVAKPDVCPLCGKIGHSVSECPADMPEKPATEAKKEPQEKPRKKGISSSDLEDIEQFPSL